MTAPLAQPPHFHAIAAFGFRPNRLYRIYVLRDRLLFAYVGPEKEVEAATVGVAIMGGLIGLMLMSILNRSQGPSNSRLDRLEDMDDMPLDEIADEHKLNFEAGPDEFTAVRFRPRSFWHSVNYNDWKHTAILQLRHRGKGSLKLAIHDAPEARLAARELGRLFGEDLSLEAEWASGRRRFVALGRGDSD